MTDAYKHRDGHLLLLVGCKVLELTGTDLEVLVSNYDGDAEAENAYRRRRYEMASEAHQRGNAPPMEVT